MKVEIIDEGKAKKYRYIKVLIADKKLASFELAYVWNYGVDCKKDGSAISIRLRRKLQENEKI